MIEAVLALSCLERLYHFLGAGVLVVIGAALALRAGSKWGWLVILGGLAWAYLTLKDMGLLPG
ncbi:MAG: hypothetical protein V2A74_01735 [bacterium]